VLAEGCCRLGASPVPALEKVQSKVLRWGVRLLYAPNHRCRQRRERRAQREALRRDSGALLAGLA
jgi:hypothetical protein